MKIQVRTFTLKDTALPELTQESRDTLNHDIPLMCEENAIEGYRQGVKNTLLGVGLTTLALGTGAAIVTVIKAKQENKQPKKKKD